MSERDYLRDKAQNVLRMFGITAPPVDVERIAAELGFLVIPYDFPDDTAAVLFIEEGVKAIGVNRLHAHAQTRFSIAHELGHYLSGHEDFHHDSRLLVDRRTRRGGVQAQQEREADRFAAELLMPEVLLRADLAGAGGRIDAPALARRYGVTEQALWIQLIDLQAGMD
jgi:Zn-dependent peptidase ImmA (M78 family)